MKAREGGHNEQRHWRSIVLIARETGMTYGVEFSCVDAEGRDIPLMFPATRAFRSPDGKDGWLFLEDFSFRLYDYIYTIKAGFDTDWASIPRVAWTAVGHPAQTTKQIGAAYHDMMYCTHLHPREYADKVLVQLFAACGESPAVCKACYDAVRAFGGTVWPKTPEQLAKYRALLHVRRVA